MLFGFVWISVLTEMAAGEGGWWHRYLTGLSSGQPCEEDSPQAGRTLCSRNASGAPEVRGAALTDREADNVSHFCVKDHLALA